MNVRDSARAWVVVVAAFTALFTVFGIAYSFGAFFEPISTEFGTGRWASSAVFSLTSLLFFTLGAISGPASDRFGPRPLLVLSAVSFGVGLAATALAGSLWVAYLTYGVGVGCVYEPTLATVGGWFERRRALALGVTVSGMGPVKMPGLVPKLSETPGKVEWYGGALGAHNEEVYGGFLGLSADEI